MLKVKSICSTRLGNQETLDRQQQSRVRATSGRKLCVGFKTPIRKPASTQLVSRHNLHGVRAHFHPLWATRSVMLNSAVNHSR
jgi:hypothetical protein